MKVRLTRTVEFTAIHRLFDASQSEEANRSRFGAVMDPHAHRYRCTVTVEGPIEDRAPMVIDLTLFDEILHQEAVERFEGKQIHLEVPPFDKVLPTCEGLAREIYGRVKDRLPRPVALIGVKVAEDEFLSAECLGDG